MSASPESRVAIALAVRAAMQAYRKGRPIVFVLPTRMPQEGQ